LGFFQDCDLYFPNSASLSYHTGSKHKHASRRKVSKNVDAKERKSDFIEHCDTDHLDRASEGEWHLNSHDQQKRSSKKRKIRKTDFGGRRKKVKVGNCENLKDGQSAFDLKQDFDDFQIEDQTFRMDMENDDDSTKIENSNLLDFYLKQEEFEEEEDLPLSVFKKKKTKNVNLRKFEIKDEEEYLNSEDHLDDGCYEDDQTGVDVEDQRNEENEKIENIEFKELEVTEIPEVWKPPPKVRRKTSKVQEVIDTDVLSTEKFDVNKVPLEPDDFETIKINQSPVK
jgi:hypothetical protein